ncbi:MAG: DUF4258 domain-containing protein [Patescibacteria group bacterium]
MEIGFTEHAEKQLLERGLSRTFVVRAIQRPSVVKRQKDGRFQFIKIFQNEQKRFLLISIVEKDFEKMIIVTVFKTSKISKYL